MPRDTNLPESLPPEIALIVLPSSKASDIAASKSFLDLSRTRDNPLSDAPNRGLGFWALSGFADEWTAEHPPARGWNRIMEFKGMIFPGFAQPLANCDSDAWEFSITRSPEYDGPNSFGGYSGGGLWQILLEGSKDAIRLKSIILSGVAYYQSGFQSGLNIIRCNGREYIHGFAGDALES